MKIKALISHLEAIKAERGNVECYLQNDTTVAHENFFVVAEHYPRYLNEPEGWAVNIRTWPY